ncbi:MAG TPA: serine hydrolase domain-containing protein [Thermoanaerobaculales bacterium]|nr:serine hydrolase domain-containing protein [Thermoanaerobaculales bacterium]HQL30814.1 serine hydrolase domain-containing protein [Thermoanaerobaculales bacterium]
MRDHALLVAAFVVLFAVVVGCRKEAPPTGSGAGLERELQALVDTTVREHPNVPAVALAVIAPRLGLDWDGAAGVADPASGAPMTPERPVLVASNTKTFVAAAVLRLVEQGRLGLDDPVAGRLSPELVEMLRGDGYDPQAIRLRHLLTHTSGLYDHTDSPHYGERILADPMHRWTRSEQVAAAMAWGDPLGMPGEIYCYCDTGYVLLGDVVERAAGAPLPAAVRELVGFERLGLSSTWWELLEPRPAGVPERANQLDGNLDSFAVDPSIDLYGGGGLTAPMGDLARFMRALFTGQVFAKPATLETMLTTIPGAAAGPGEPGPRTTPDVYRMGVFVVEEGGLTVYRHTGYWATVASYAPALDVALAAVVTQRDGKALLGELEKRVLNLARTAQGEERAAGER